MGLTKHVNYASGKRKTVCVSNVLTALGIPVEAYRVTWNGRKNIWDSIMRRHGFSVRSRMSWLPKGASVGQVRKVIRKLIRDRKDPLNTVYAVSTGSHLLLLGNHGQTLVDTNPRKRDRRQVVRIYAVTRSQ